MPDLKNVNVSIYKKYENAKLPSIVTMLEDVRLNGYQSQYVVPWFAKFRGLILSLSKRYSTRLSPEDSMSECFLIFVDCVLKYDPSKGGLRTYLYTKFQHCIQMANARMGGAIAVPRDLARSQAVDYSFTFDLPNPELDEELSIFEELQVNPIDWDDLKALVPPEFKKLAVALYEKGDRPGVVAKHQGLACNTVMAQRSRMLKRMKKHFDSRQLSLFAA